MEFGMLASAICLPVYLQHILTASEGARTVQSNMLNAHEIFPRWEVLRDCEVDILHVLIDLTVSLRLNISKGTPTVAWETDVLSAIRGCGNLIHLEPDSSATVERRSRSWGLGHVDVEDLCRVRKSAGP